MNHLIILTIDARTEHQIPQYWSNRELRGTMWVLETKNPGLLKEIWTIESCLQTSPLSCLSFCNNPLGPLSAALTFMDVEPFTRAWSPYQEGDNFNKYGASWAPSLSVLKYWLYWSCSCLLHENISARSWIQRFFYDQKISFCISLSKTGSLRILQIPLSW